MSSSATTSISTSTPSSTSERDRAAGCTLLTRVMLSSSLGSISERRRSRSGAALLVYTSQGGSPFGEASAEQRGRAERCRRAAIDALPCIWDAASAEKLGGHWSDHWKGASKALVIARASTRPR